MTQRVGMALAATGWGVAVALLAWSSFFDGPEPARAWALLIAAGSVLTNLSCMIRRAQRIVIEAMSLQIRMHTAQPPPTGLTLIK
jgi:hypothetical protein